MPKKEKKTRNKSSPKERVLEISEKGIFVKTDGEPPFKIEATKLMVKRPMALRLAFNPNESRSAVKLASLTALKSFHEAIAISHCRKTPYCINEDGHAGPCYDNLHEIEIYPDELSRAGADWANLYITKISMKDGHEIWEGRTLETGNPLIDESIARRRRKKK